MVDQWKALALFPAGTIVRDPRHPDTPRAGFELLQNLSSCLVEWSCAPAITAAPQTVARVLSVYQINIYQALCKNSTIMKCRKYICDTIKRPEHRYLTNFWNLRFSLKRYALNNKKYSIHSFGQNCRVTYQIKIKKKSYLISY